jgi:hypothetical protein
MASATPSGIKREWYVYICNIFSVQRSLSATIKQKKTVDQQNLCIMTDVKLHQDIF